MTNAMKRFPTYPRTLVSLASILALMLGATSGWAKTGTPADASGKASLDTRWWVDCNRGDRLAHALGRARPGARLWVRGVCNEQVRISKDDIRITGVDGAAVDGDIGERRFEGTVTVAGARGVVIRNLEVRNGPDQGIVVRAGSSARLSHVTARGNATVGITVDASYAELDNVAAKDNGAGFDFFTGATVIARGHLAAIGNQGAGVAINGNSCLELRGSVLEATGNGGDGVTLVNDSDLLILSFPEAQGSGVRAIGNRGAAGLFVANSSLAIVGSSFVGSGANVFEVSNNYVGMLFVSANLASPFATAKFNVSDNETGIVFADGTDATVVGGLNVTDNDIGMIGDGAGVVRLSPDERNPSTVVGNDSADVLMLFGSRIEIKPGVDVGIFSCDTTVLTPPFGAAPCP